MKNKCLSLLFAPLVLLSQTPYLTNIHHTINAQQRLNTNLLLSTIWTHQDEDLTIDPSFLYTSTDDGDIISSSLALTGANDEDELKMKSLLEYSYDDHKHSKSRSHNVSGGLSALLKTPLSIFAGLSGGANFNTLQSLVDYKQYYASGALGLGYDIPLLDDTTRLTPIAYLNYTFLQLQNHKGLETIPTQHYNHLSVNAGLIAQTLFGSMQINLYGIYSHSVLDNTLHLATDTQRFKLDSAQWLVNLGANLGFYGDDMSFKLGLSSEISKNFYNVGLTSSVGFEF
ncbi:hypothetical protein BBW65_02120 [Helicobacter enhydrae]|uniref:Autotransporter outer membrane beta-barrel domain-containing protein n=1 Tax=Helicobacter enhydrae TaxID=222136 RepID=A0A1B1U4F1_9HELI|nr:autotransporter outer membrane beta-barrel domain-containing protein [Helicobacter enhydrae]ANV97674.1 hypothetical protein BBW65_02120 [Helicobacter enhydrae]